MSDNETTGRESLFDARTSFLLDEVGKELTHARARFHSFNSPHEGWAVVKEELDELWDDVKANEGHGSHAYKEAIQVAAMALRYAYDLSGVAQVHDSVSVNQ